MNDTNQNNNKQTSSNIILLSEVFPDNVVVLPIENRPVFPGVTIPLSFTGSKFITLINEAIDNNERFIGVSLIKEVNEKEYLNSEVYQVGTLLKIIKIINQTDDNIHFFAQALDRFKMVRPIKKNNILKWEVKYFEREKITINEELKALQLAIMASVKDLINKNPLIQEQMRLSLSQMGYENPGLLMDVISTLLTVEPEKLQDLLETIDIQKRGEKLLLMLKQEIEISMLQEKIQKQIEEKVSRQQRDYFLQEQLKVIKKELGLEKDDKQAEIEKIEERVKNLKLSEEAAQVIKEEIEKLKVLEPVSPEFQVTRAYLNVLSELPWGVYTKTKPDIRKARKILDEQHYGLDDVKNRILEFISTIIKKNTVSGSIICLVGPPGVGKTSVGKSIADALGRKFYRFSVGGMRDEAEIKGHRRTYIGAMPGKIIQSLKRTGTADPVIMLDEIDKIGISYQGDPASALLEVLDPEQNKDFLDHYLDVRFDLSNILFITTANQLDTIPRPLLDRMEIISLSGYILEEKVQIAKKYLIPKQREAHGLSAKEIKISNSALIKIIDGYAREAGVRGLENQVKKIMRKVTLKQTEDNSKSFSVSARNVEDYLGKPIFITEELYKRIQPGVTLGLAWTSMGGATLYIEASGIKGKAGGFKQTGQLGKVMQESSEIAYSYVRSILSGKEDGKSYFDDHFIHLHVPAGATPKDGPSAGITMALALYSLATGKPVKQGLAMTGELTLTGKVLPIGGVREKTIAARRVGVFNLIFPKDNKKDFDELPSYIRKGITPHFVDYFDDVLKEIYEGKE